MKLHLIVAKRQSKTKGTTYLTASVKAGEYGKTDYFFINVLNAMALTNMSIDELNNAQVGVLFDKDLEV